MSERPGAYVGVSGVVSREQQVQLRDAAQPLASINRRLALGVKAVHKTQWLDIENKYGRDWYTVGDEICDVVVADNDGEMRVAQMFLDVNEAERQGIENYESRFVSRLMGRAATWLTGVQFDLLPWHVKDYRPLFEEMRERNPKVDIILQCQGPIMTELGPQKAAKRLDLYRPYLTHALFDASHGTGAMMDPSALRPFVEEAYQRKWLGVGVAGGLNKNVVEQALPELLNDFPDLSFDAEGQLHQHAREADKSLNMKIVRDYLETSATVIRRARTN